MTSPAHSTFLRRIEFSDTDAAGVAHFTRLLAFVEEAEHAFFRSRGVEPFDGVSGWPRVAMETRFLAPCKFGDTLEISLAEWTVEGSRLQFSFSAEIAGRDSKVECFRGVMRVCHVRIDAGGAFQPMEVPEEIRSALLGQGD